MAGPPRQPLRRSNPVHAVTGAGHPASCLHRNVTAGEPSKLSELLALNIYNTFYGRTGWEGVGQAKAVIFCLVVVAIGLIQLRVTRSKEVQQ